MNSKDLAALLDGREYGKEITRDEEAQAKADGLVVVYGASDDLMEFGGAISDELGASNGSLAYLTADGMLENACDDDGCPYFEKIKATAATIKAVWDRDGYSWIYETAIPHVTFEIFEDGETYCRGIVFALADVKGGAA